MRIRQWVRAIFGLEQMGWVEAVGLLVAGGGGWLTFHVQPSVGDPLYLWATWWVVICGSILLFARGLLGVVQWAVSGRDATSRVRETQQVLGEAAHNGQELLGRLNRYSARDGDDVAAEYWRNQIQRWTDWAARLVSWRLPHMMDSFANDAGRDARPFIGPAWQHHLRTWMDVRMVRLNELILNAEHLQGPLGAKPTREDLVPPTYPDPPEPSQSVTIRLSG